MGLLDSKQQSAAAIVLLLGVAIVIALSPYVTGLVGVPVLYAVFAPVQQWLARRMREQLAALLVVALALFLIVVPGVSFAGLVVAQAQQIAGSVVRNPILGRLAQLQIAGVDLGPRIADLGAQVVSWIATTRSSGAWSPRSSPSSPSSGAAWCGDRAPSRCCSTIAPVPRCCSP